MAGLLLIDPTMDRDAVNAEADPIFSIDPGSSPNVQLLVHRWCSSSMIPVNDWTKGLVPWRDRDE